MIHKSLPRAVIEALKGHPAAWANREGTVHYDIDLKMWWLIVPASLIGGMIVILTVVAFR